MATCGSLTWPKQVVLSEWAYTLKHHQHIVKHNDSYDSYDIMTLKEMEGVGAAKRSGRLCRRGSLLQVLLPRHRRRRRPWKALSLTKRSRRCGRSRPRGKPGRLGQGGWTSTCLGAIAVGPAIQGVKGHFESIQRGASSVNEVLLGACK